MPEETPNSSRPLYEKWIVIFGLLALLVLLGIFFVPLRDFVVRNTAFLLDKDGARAHILAQPHAAAYFVGLQTLQVIVSPIPGELSCFLGGLIFGWLPGFLYSTLGLTIGSLVNISLGRFFERIFLERVIPRRILDRFEAKSRRWGLWTVFILFLFPGAPKDTLCYLFGLTRIPVLVFLLVSSVARLPGTLVLCLQGAKIIEGDWTFFIVLTVTGLLVTIPALVFKKKIYAWFGITDGSEEVK
jgi:uncharacterized membrane protein YdjX (TVP38/TMEM64 family)